MQPGGSCRSNLPTDLTSEGEAPLLLATCPWDLGHRPSPHGCQLEGDTHSTKPGWGILKEQEMVLLRFSKQLPFLLRRRASVLLFLIFPAARSASSSFTARTLILVAQAPCSVCLSG